MQYESVVPATFLERPNRFVARVLLGGREELVHVKNTGRCRELLVKGATVYLAPSSSEGRKTRFDLVCVEKQREGKSSLLINLDSSAPNRAAWEYLQSGNLIPAEAVLRREVFFGASRLDLYAEWSSHRAYFEVKGVTLEKDGLALFPDAPTLRGLRHVKELIEARRQGYDAYLLFLIQMEGMQAFSPNDETQPAFGRELCRATREGVRVLPLECRVTPDSLWVNRLIPLRLPEMTKEK